MQYLQVARSSSPSVNIVFASERVMDAAKWRRRAVLAGTAVHNHHPSLLCPACMSMCRLPGAGQFGAKPSPPPSALSSASGHGRHASTPHMTKRTVQSRRGSAMPPAAVLHRVRSYISTVLCSKGHHVVVAAYYILWLRNRTSTPCGVRRCCMPDWNNSAALVISPHCQRLEDVVGTST